MTLYPSPHPFIALVVTSQARNRATTGPGLGVGPEGSWMATLRAGALPHPIVLSGEEKQR